MLFPAPKRVCEVSESRVTVSKQHVLEASGGGFMIQLSKTSSSGPVFEGQPPHRCEMVIAKIVKYIHANRNSQIHLRCQFAMPKQQIRSEIFQALEFSVSNSQFPLK